MTPNEIELFKQTVYNYYNDHKRDFPWRHTQNPYHILVSEIMLQQTPVHRIISKYQEFIATFPTVESLAKTPLVHVLAAWQGLGYNRRAKFLKAVAEEITNHHQGIFPKTLDELTKLPGIGRPTAAAILTYAFNKPVAFIETNVRTIFIHHFFKDQSDISDKDILPFVEQTLDHQNPRAWYSALMDYGTHLKQTIGNLNTKSKHYVKQSTFKGSRRQIRGKILKVLITTKTVSLEGLSISLNISKEQLITIIDQLIKEGLITQSDTTYQIKS